MQKKIVSFLLIILILLSSCALAQEEDLNVPEGQAVISEETENITSAASEEEGLTEDEEVLLTDYVEDPDTDISFTISLLDQQSGKFVSEHNGILNLVPQAGYRMVYSLKTGKDAGIDPGRYRLPFPEEMNLPDAAYTPSTKKVSGVSFTHYFRDDNQFILDVPEEAASLSSISLSVTTNVSFEASEEVLDLGFDVLVLPEGDNEYPVSAELSKSGHYSFADGLIHWEIEALIPAYSEGSAYTQVEITDMTSSRTERWCPDFDNLEITLQIGDKTETLQPWSEDCQSDFCYRIMDASGSHSGIEILSRCICNASLCPASGCGEETPGYCSCWCLKKNARVTIAYTDSESASDLLMNGEIIRNTAYFLNLISEGAVKKPDPIQKSLTQSADDNQSGSVAFQILLNSEGADLGAADLIIEDRMSENLKPVPGSFQVVRISQGVDGVAVETTLDPTGYALTMREDGHGFDLTIHAPGMDAYRIDYQAQLSEETDFLDEYGNEASVTLTGKQYTSSVSEYFLSEIDAKRLQIELIKTDAYDESLPVAGARYRLSTESGTILAEEVTDESGRLTFAYNWVTGLILREDATYIIEEIEAPAGYALDTTKYTFRLDGTLTPEGASIEEGTLTLPVTDTPVFVLPETGFGGARKWTFAGITICLISAAGLCCMRRRSRDNRSC